MARFSILLPQIFLHSEFFLREKNILYEKKNCWPNYLFINWISKEKVGRSNHAKMYMFVCQKSNFHVGKGEGISAINSRIWPILIFGNVLFPSFSFSYANTFLLYFNSTSQLDVAEGEWPNKVCLHHWYNL